MILVAGGSGRLGRELLPLLLSQGLDVRMLTRDPSRMPHIDKAIEVIRGDVRDSDSLSRALHGVEWVVSAVSGFGPGGEGPAAVDYQGNVNLIRAAEQAGVTRFVLLSVQDAGPDHPMQLMRMKHLAEESLRASRLDWRIVRPTAFLELWAEVIGNPIVKRGATTVFGRGDNPINFVSVIDVARVVAAALADATPGHTAISVGGPENLSMNELAGRIAVQVGKRPTVRRIPRTVMRLSRSLLGPFKPDIAGMIEAGIVMDTADMTFDATQLRRVFPQLIPSTADQVIDKLFAVNRAA